MIDTEFKQRIQMLEDKLQLKFSDEQLAVLKNNYQQPVLINACAGAGKTTLLLVSIVMQILDGVKPQTILAITFSRNARENMEVRFKQLVKTLALKISPIDYPRFRTFDALFLKLVKTIDPSVRIYDKKAASRYKRTLSDAVVHQFDMLSDKEVVDDILHYKDTLINHKLSTTGLDFKAVSPNLAGFQVLGRQVGREIDQTFYENYMSVVKKLVQIKTQNNYADFTDLKVRLNQMLNDGKQHDRVVNQLKFIQRCLIDEFQDIDQVQWDLVMALLNPKAKRHLAVIGDDDQSIYTFRGSDPKIIMEYPKTMPNAKIFNLTTNYRTSGPVLSAVTPMIENNQYRMVKSLRVADNHQNIGDMRRFDGNTNRLGGDLLLDRLIEVIKSPNVKRSEVALLCRNNMDLTLASDYLAQRGYYVALNKRSQVLQFNLMYVAMIGLMVAFHKNQFKQFQQSANVVLSGFTKYQDHVNHIASDAEIQLETISDYLIAANEYQKNHYVEPKLLRIDHDVEQTLTTVQELDANPHPLKALFKIIESLTDGYYEWMIEKKHLSATEHDLVMDHIGSYIDQHLELSIEDFLKQEQHKRKTFLHILTQVDEGITNPDWIQGLTVHAAKGLEYEYVFVYNFRKNGLSLDKLHLTKSFTMHMSRDAFLQQVLTVNFSNFGNQIAQSNDTDVWQQLGKLQYDLQTLQRTGQTSMLQAIVDDDVTQIDYNNQLAEDFNDGYDAVQSILQYIEEERRLVYVAMTRSSYATYYNKDDQEGVLLTTPLLDEVFVDNDHIMVANHNGKPETLVQSVQHNKQINSGEVKDFTIFF